MLTYGFPQYDREQLAEAAKLQLSKGFTALKLVVAVDVKGWRADAARRARRAGRGNRPQCRSDDRRELSLQSCRSENAVPGDRGLQHYLV